jgi:hypothetical protein
MKTFDPNLYNSIRVLPSYGNSGKYFNIDLESGDQDYIERWLKASKSLMKAHDRKIKIKKIYGR